MRDSCKLMQLKRVQTELDFQPGGKEGLGTLLSTLSDPLSKVIRNCKILYTHREYIYLCLYNFYIIIYLYVCLFLLVLARSKRAIDIVVAYRQHHCQAKYSMYRI